MKQPKLSCLKALDSAEGISIVEIRISRFLIRELNKIIIKGGCKVSGDSGISSSRNCMKKVILKFRK